MIPFTYDLNLLHRNSRSMISFYAMYVRNQLPLFTPEKFYIGYRVFPVSDMHDGFKHLDTVRRMKLWQQECGMNFPL